MTFYQLLGLTVASAAGVLVMCLLLIFCYVAGSPSIARDNEQIKESD